MLSEFSGPGLLEGVIAYAQHIVLLYGILMIVVWTIVFILFTLLRLEESTEDEGSDEKVLGVNCTSTIKYFFFINRKMCLQHIVSISLCMSQYSFDQIY